MRYLGKSVLLATCLITEALLVPSNAQADAFVPAPSYYIAEARLAQVVDRIAVDNGLSPVIEGDLNKSVRSVHLSGGLDEIFARLSVDHGLDIFDFNGVLYASSTELRSTRLLSREGFDSDDLQLVLSQSGVPANVIQVRRSESSEALVITGPPSAIGLIDAFLQNAVIRNTIRIRRGVTMEGEEVDKSQ